MTHEPTPQPTLAEAIAALPPDQRVHYYAGAAKETARQTVVNARRCIDRITEQRSQYDLDVVCDILTDIITANRAVADQDVRWHRDEVTS